jgi:hypothetical protein
MKKLALVLFVVFTATTVWAGPPRFSKDLRTLTAWYQGEYDNSAQHRRDSSVAYTEAYVVRIWENLYTDAIWMYEELVDKNKLTISQRIYRFTDGQTGVFEATIYNLSDMARFKGEYKNTRPFDELDPETDLNGLLECTVYFRAKGEKKYSGSTIGKECGYGKKNARYVVSLIDVYEDKLMRADRGMGWDDEIMWGPAKDSKGFEFKRQVPEIAKPAPKNKK